VKGSNVKPLAPQWPARISAHTAFFSYRWLAWAIAALALTLPGRPITTLPRDAGILLLAGVINVVATALAQSYVRLAQTRPALLALDLIGGAAILWLSGSAPLPFLPYALSGLVLPALLYTWRGGLLGAVAFIGLDLTGLAMLSANPETPISGSALFVRLFTPLAFAMVWITIGRRMAMNEPIAQGLPPTATNLLRQAATRPNQPDAGQPPRGTPGADRARPESLTPFLDQLTSPLPLVLTRAAEQRADPGRRLLYDVTPDPGGGLTAALDQLAALVGQGGLEVRVSSTGALRPLALAHQTVLLRVAQEALLNIQQHARAHTALLHLDYEADRVALVVQDDGVGLLDGTYERPGLHALRAVRYRLAELDGQLEVCEGESGGVTVRAALPYA
jgi:hypothetical protein